MWLLQIWLAIFDSFQKKKKVYQVVKEFVQIKSFLTFIFCRHLPKKFQFNMFNAGLQSFTKTYETYFFSKIITKMFN